MCIRDRANRSPRHRSYQNPQERLDPSVAAVCAGRRRVSRDSALRRIPLPLPSQSVSLVLARQHLSVVHYTDASSQALVTRRGWSCTHGRIVFSSPDALGLLADIRRTWRDSALAGARAAAKTLGNSACKHKGAPFTVRINNCFPMDHGWDGCLAGVGARLHGHRAWPS